MTVYSYAQLEQLWINAGGPASVAPVAAAVAEAESGGNDQATNPTDNGGTQTSWGLWQISNGTHAQPVPNILDPLVNAQQAVAKWKGEGGSFSPAWGTYDSGAYKAFLSPGTTPNPNGVPSGSGTGTGTATLTSADTTLGNTCLVGIPNPVANAPIVGSLFSQNLVCFLTKSEARAVIGGAMIAVSGAVAIVGTLVLVAYGLKRTGALGKAADVAAVIPGGQMAAAGLSTVQHRANATGAQARERRDRQRHAELQRRLAAERQGGEAGNAGNSEEIVS